MNLRQIRTQLHWTQEHMARELGISLRTYCRQEKAGGSPSLLKLASLIYCNESKQNSLKS
jgi:DNA-binding XRE family transcriptional regulator